MAINFIVNDPHAPGAVAQPIAPTAEPASTKPSFLVDQLPAEQVYPPGTGGFLAWQAREGALRALETFQAIAGPLDGWMGDSGTRLLDLKPNDGRDLNAYYDRSSISFFEFPIGAAIVYSGASTDVVAHETGHAILDALRPDIWNVNMLEVQAFHEGFGDCVAIMTALSDRDTRLAILQGDPTLSNANFAETTAEQLSATIAKAEGPNHNAAAPRHALNTFLWAFPQSLPFNGKPTVLINEVHSFGQLSSGCYYQLILELYRAGAAGEAGLWVACQAATKLLALAVKAAQIKPRFLEAVGRAMILVDRQQGTAADGSGHNEAHIKTAFAHHGIALSVTTFLAPRAVLSTRSRKTKAIKAGDGNAAQMATTLTAPIKRQLRSMFDIAPAARLGSREFDLGQPGNTEVTGFRPVDLSGLAEALQDVKAYTPQVVLVGDVGGATAVLGAVDPGVSISSEVRDYVSMLVARKLIDFGNRPKRRAAKGSAAIGLVAGSSRATHRLRRRGKEVVLERVCFGCQCIGTMECREA